MKVYFFSLTKDIRIKLILYYQTLYTTEAANNTEFQEHSIFSFVLSCLSFAIQESTVQNNISKLTRNVTLLSIKGYTVSTKQINPNFPASLCKVLGKPGVDDKGQTCLGWEAVMMIFCSSDFTWWGEGHLQYWCLSQDVKTLTLNTPHTRKIQKPSDIAYLT